RIVPRSIGYRSSSASKTARSVGEPSTSSCTSVPTCASVRRWWGNTTRIISPHSKSLVPQVRAPFFGALTWEVSRPILCRLIPQEHTPIAEHPRLHQLQRQLLPDAVKHRPPLTQHHRSQRDLELVNQSFLRQLRHDAAASQNHQIGARLLLHSAYFGRQLALRQRRVLP